MNGSRRPRVTCTGISSRPVAAAPVRLADAIGPRRREEHLRRVDDRAALPAARRDGADRGRLRGEVRRAGEDRRVVGDAELLEDVEDLVGDRVPRRAEADGPLAHAPARWRARPPRSAARSRRVRGARDRSGGRASGWRSRAPRPPPRAGRALASSRARSLPIAKSVSGKPPASASARRRPSATS